MRRVTRSTEKPGITGPLLTLSLLGLIALSSLLSGCANSERSVSVILYNQRDPFIYTFSQQLTDLAEPWFPLEVLESQNSQILQNEQIDTLAQRGRQDLIILNPVDRLGAYAMVKKLKERDIPVIFFNREPIEADLDLWEQAYYVGARAEQSGQLQAQLIIDLFGNDPEQLNMYDRNGDNIIQIVILKGEQGHQDAEIRTKEVVRTFQTKGFELEILTTEVANWNIDQAYTKMATILSEFSGQIEAVLANNDAMAMGAIRRMQEAGLFMDTNGNFQMDPLDESWIPVVGIDGLSEAVDLIDQGYLYGTVLNDSLSQAQAIVELSRLILGDISQDEMHFELIDETYIWVDYKVFTLD